MKKQELCHVHGLLDWVLDRFEEAGLDVDTEEYQELGVKPTSIHKSKVDQKEAVLALAASLADAAEASRAKYLRFDEATVREGKLAPRSEAEPHLMKMVANVAEADPERVEPYLPFTICFIRNGDEATTRAAIETVYSLLGHSESSVEDIVDPLLEASVEIEDSRTESEFQQELMKAARD